MAGQQFSPHLTDTLVDLRTAQTGGPLHNDVGQSHPERAGTPDTLHRPGDAEAATAHQRIKVSLAQQPHGGVLGNLAARAVRDHGLQLRRLPGPCPADTAVVLLRPQPGFTPDSTATRRQRTADKERFQARNEARNLPPG